jgi:predicted nuclease with RNAse H fold
VRTLGIDLASQPENSAACVIDWERSRVDALSLGWGDQDLIDGIAAASKTGIDAPFGWPEPFVQALTAPRWPSDPGEPRTRFERRATDLWVRRETGKLPMSVSTDRIAYCAMRARVLIGDEPRDGSGRVVEAYPDASLRRWLPDLLPWTSYKRVAGEKRREEILGALLDRLRLDLDGHERACIDSDDCLDALVCALVARAAARGETVPPDDARLANVEGWIHLPRRGSLMRLSA